MNYTLLIKPAAEKQLRHLSELLQRRIMEKLAGLQANPRLAGAVKLAGAAATWRVRVGDYRIAYEIDDAERMVFVTIIAHLREVYRGI